MRFTIDRIDHIVLNVTDVDIAAAWYQRVLGMEREDFGPHSRTALKFGGQKINLRPHDHDVYSWPTGATHEAGAGDLCFITAVPPDEVIGHLRPEVERRHLGKKTRRDEAKIQDRDQGRGEIGP